MASDLRLGWRPTEVSQHVANELAVVLEGWVGPGVVVLAGDAFALLNDPQRDPGRVIDAHPRLASALERFGAEADRQMVVLVGHHDACLAWHTKAVDTLVRRYGARVALAAELRVVTGVGLRRVRIEHGHQLDPMTARVNPRDPAESPIGQHVVVDFLPGVESEQASWLAGIGDLDDPADTAAFIASRLAYRRLARQLWWLVVPLLMAGVLVAVGAAVDLVRRPDEHALIGMSGRLAVIGVIVLADVLLVAFLLGAVMRRSFRSLAGVGPFEARGGRNDAARVVADRFVQPVR